MATEKATWVDFQKIKMEANIERVLDHCGIFEHLEKRGDELVGWCPLGEEHGKGDSFAFNVATKSFQCSACKARGSVIDFVRKYKNISLRTAATSVLEIMKMTSDACPFPQVPAEESRPYGKKPSGDQKNAPAEPRRRALPVECFVWDEALELVRQEKLDPQYLVVLHPTFR